MILEERDPLGRNPIEIALEADNVEFLSAPRVTRISNTLWGKPYFLAKNQFTAEDVSINGLITTMLTTPRDFFMLPVARFLLEYAT